MELQGQDLTNLPLGLSLPRPKLPVFSYQPQLELLQGSVPLINLQQGNSMQHLCAQPAQNQQPEVLCKAEQNQPQQTLLGQYHCQQEQENVLTNNDDSGFDLMDDSLTDMQWLQRMDGGGVPSITKGCRKHATSRGTEKENSKRGKEESCRKKLEYTTSKKLLSSNKPPLSYASLIALAICSTPQRMMTLSGIYRWIENTFPFYRTPEAKAWKNSIRHNLSIRKNMFMKVYQYPPRRGNGSYWTLLSDGEEELKRAVPLFSTFRPPVIDSNCIYSRGAATTHTVKSKGQYIPLLPRNTLASTNQAYFSVDGALSSGARVEEVTTEVVLDSAHLESEVVCFTEKHHESDKNIPTHILEHSYAKLGHVAAGDLQDYSSESEKEHEACPPTPKRKKSTKKSTFRRTISAEGPYRTSQKDVEEEVHSTEEKEIDDGGFHTPPKDQDSSLHLLDASLLTPLRNLDADVEIGPISFSPLYTNFVTPKRGTCAEDSSSPVNTDSTDLADVAVHTPTSSSSSSAAGIFSSSSNPLASNTLPLPLTPLRSFTSGNCAPIGGLGSFDSGIFSPLSADTFNTVKFSTPILSPLTDLLQPNTFSTPHPPDYLTPLKVLDFSHSNGNTPHRVGSLGGLGLPGFTPPTASLKTSRK